MPAVSRFVRAIGWRLEPLLHPDADRQREALEALATGQRRRLDGLEKLIARQGRQIDRLAAAVDGLRDDELKALGRGLRGVQARVRRELAFSERVLKRVTTRQQEWRAERARDRLARLAAGRGDILVGPWTGEVGFELIYWIPFVRWFAGRYGVDPERFVILSRGGAEPWYDGLGRRYVDAFDLVGLDALRAGTAAEEQKHRTLRAFDRDLIRRARAGLTGAARVLHPALLHHLLTPFWRREAGTEWATGFGAYRRYNPPPEPPGAPLPSRFTAVRFYFSRAFPDTASNRTFVRRTVEALAAQGDVVLIAPRVLVDDHRDAIVPESARVRVVTDLPPARNLALQTAIIARARLFVGTYGGFAYLAPLYGVPSVTFYSDRTFYRHHLLLAAEIAERVGGGALAALDVADVARLREMLSPAAEPAGAGLAGEP